MTENFGKMIREYRLVKGWTQAQLAEALGYDNPQFISLIERQQSKVPLQTLGQLVVILGIPEHLIVEDLVQQYESAVASEIEQGKKTARKKKA